jgi:hypothetical protein
MIAMALRQRCQEHTERSKLQSQSKSLIDNNLPPSFSVSTSSHPDAAAAAALRSGSSSSKQQQSRSSSSSVCHPKRNVLSFAFSPPHCKA